MAALIEIINAVIELFVVLLFFRQMLRSRPMKRSISSAVIAFVLLVHIGRSFIPFETYTNIAITCLLWSILAAVLFKDIIIKKITVLLLYFVALTAADVLGRFIMAILLNTANSYKSPVGIQRYVGMTVIGILLFAFLSCIAIFSNRKKEAITLKYWLMMMLFPIFSLFIVIITDTFIVMSGTGDIRCFILLLVIIVGLIYFNMMVFEFIDSYSAKLQLETAERLIKQQEENYHLLEINERELRKLRHNINEHIAVIQSIVDNSSVSESKELMQSVKKLASLPTSITYTNDATLDSILNIECKKATEKGIQYLVKTQNIAEPINIAPLDKSTILCNAIDNAIEACQSLSEKFIVIDISSDINKVKICIQNSSRPLTVKNNLIVSTKADHINHGFGIESIRMTLAKYNGIFNITYGDGIAKCVIVADNQKTDG